MKAIKTKFVGATNTKPSRISAKAESLKAEIYTCNALEELRLKLGLEHVDLHIIAARQYAFHLGWDNTLVSGGLPGGDWAHCLLPDVVTETLKLGNVLFDVVSCSERFTPLASAIKDSIKALNI